MRANKMRLVTLGALLLFCTFAASHAFAQNVQFTQGSIGSGLDNTMRIPIQVYPGRGSTSLPVTLYYSSRVWRLDNITTLNYQSYYQSVAQAMFAEHSKAGWTTSLDLPIIEWPKSTDTYYYSGGAECIPCGGLGGYRVRRVYILMPDGARHELRQDDVARHEGIVMTGTFYAVDGSRLRYDSTGEKTGTLYMPDGTRYVLGDTNPSYYIDRHGNTLTFNPSSRVWTDTLNRPVGVPLPADPELLPLDANGITRTFTYNGKGIDNTDSSANALRVVGSEYLPIYDAPPNTTTNVPHSNGQPSLFVADGPEDGSGVNTLVVGEMKKWSNQGKLFNPVVLAEVRLPNGLSYKFSYNIYGEVDKITYPTGAYETYGYLGLPANGETPPYSEANRGVVQRKLSAKGDGSDLVTWSYSSTGTVITTTSPDCTVTESYRLNYDAPQHGTKFYWAFGFTDARNGMVYDERVYAPGATCGQKGALLRRTLTDWAQSTNTVPQRPGAPASGNNVEQAYRNPRATKEVSLVLDTGDANALASTTLYSYDYNSFDRNKELTVGLDETSSSQYDFAPVDQTTAQSNQTTAQTITNTGPLLLTTTTTYGLSQSADYVSRHLLALPTSVVVQDSFGTLARTDITYDEAAYLTSIGATAAGWTAPPADAKRGLATTARRYVSFSPATYLETHTTYDQWGNVRIMEDARGAKVTTDYAAAFEYAYATQTTTDAPGWNGSTAPFVTDYDSMTGLVKSTTDVNNSQTTSFSYRDDNNVPDPLNRLRQVSHPAGSWTKYIFNDALDNLYTETQTKQGGNAGEVLDSFQYFDPMGRTARSFIKEDNTNYIAKDTEYDTMGRVKRSSNPYRTSQRSATGSEAVYWTASHYDAMGRVDVVTMPDTTTIQTAYSGVYTTVTDQAGKQRRQQADALGRTIRVDEATGSGLGNFATPNQATYYYYDGLGNLVHIKQGTGAEIQDRYFKYDGISRMTYESQVEAAHPFVTAQDPWTQNTAWSRQMIYDQPEQRPDGSFVSRKGLITDMYDARQIRTQYFYDNLARIREVNYSDSTPDVTYFYDTQQFTVANSGTVYNARKLTEVRTEAKDSIPSTSQAYNYDALGRVTQNRQMVGTNEYVMWYGYNYAGQMASQKYPSGLVVKYAYDAAARLKTVYTASYGVRSYASLNYDGRGLMTSLTLGNGAVMNADYNSRLQLSTLSLTKNGSTLQRYDYKYGTFDQAGTLDETKNNGQIAQVEGFIGAAKQWKQKYEYDAVGRLYRASEYHGTSGALTYQMTYDYDVFGNRYQTQAANPQALPFAEVQDTHINRLNNHFKVGITENDNRQREVSHTDGTGAVKSVYDGTGQRVATMTGTSVDNILVYDVQGKLVAEYGQTPVPRGASYMFTDHQGSTRLVTDMTGAVVSRQDYQPFGAEIAANVGSRINDALYAQATSARQKDEGSLNNHTLWRKYDSSSGRWTSPDPYGGSMTLSNPQSFNRYTYVNNDPVNLVDPTGLMLADIGVFQTGDPEEAKIAEHQSLRNLQLAVNDDYRNRQRPPSIHQDKHSDDDKDPAKKSHASKSHTQQDDHNTPVIASIIVYIVTTEDGHIIRTAANPEIQQVANEFLQMLFNDYLDDYARMKSKFAYPDDTLGDAFRAVAKSTIEEKPSIDNTLEEGLKDNSAGERERLRQQMFERSRREMDVTSRFIRAGLQRDLVAGLIYQIRQEARGQAFEVYINAPWIPPKY
jgi:RHS repeat-associated protein